MHITLSPFAPLPGQFVPLTASLAGDVLTINGVEFNFGPLPDGATLPAEAIDSPWIIGPVSRIDGELHLTLLLPYVSDGSHFEPSPIHVTEDGMIPLPTDEVPA
jgi:hypothetical protein